MAIDNFQKQQLDKLRENKEHYYFDASIYTILLDLIQGNGLKNVCEALESLSEELETPITIKP